MSISSKYSYSNSMVLVRKTVWIPMVAVMFLFALRGISSYADLLMNLGLIELVPLWQVNTQQTLDPACTLSTPPMAMQKQIQDSFLLDSTNPNKLVHLGRISWLSGECESAVMQWEQVSVERNVGAMFELFRVGRYESLSTEERLSLATMAIKHADKLVGEEQQVAFQWYHRAFILVPTNLSAIALVNLTGTAGNPADEEKLWQALLTQLPATEAGYWWAKARILERQTDWVNAALAYTEGRQFAAMPYEFWMQAGTSWEKASDWENAIAAYENALHAQPDTPQPYISLGNVYRTQQQYQLALIWYNKARIVEPRYSDPDYFTGLTYFMMQDYTQARLLLEKLVERSPNHVSARYLLAQILYEQNEPDLAEAWLLAAIHHPAVDTPIAWWIQLGDWRLEWQNCLGAREAYLQAKSLNEFDPLVQPKLRTLTEICNP